MILKLRKQLSVAVLHSRFIFHVTIANMFKAMSLAHIAKPISHEATFALTATRLDTVGRNVSKIVLHLEIDKNLPFFIRFKVFASIIGLSIIEIVYNSGMQEIFCIRVKFFIAPMPTELFQT
jgi:hypothetical protein